ncbi:MAG: DsbE family thiol:disulfide interchange protein [Gammaproteobacteria bacterium]|nr:DsbE family thiol:disulfide interchange protein [Gammaproteobacteria bacterium]
MNFRFVLPLVIVGLLGIVFWRGLFLNPTEVPSPLIGKPVPTFDLPGLYDESEGLSSADFEGEVSLLNVFGSWCPGCHEEHPLLMRFAATHDIPLHGLNWKDDRQAAITWLNRSGNPYTRIGYDLPGNVGIDWGVYGAPETFVVDARGIIRYKHIGPLTTAVIEQHLLPTIEELRAEARALPGGAR